MNVVVIGSGIAGVTFAEEFHKLSPSDMVTVVTEERAGYYSRPLLSHGFSRPDIEERIVLKSFEALATGGIQVLSGHRVTSIGRRERTLAISHDGGNQRIGYDRLILAQGSAAFIPPPFAKFTELFSLVNSYADLIALRKLRGALVAQSVRPRWAIIGGGLIGCEVASDLAVVGDSVSLFHAMPRLMERQLDDEDSSVLLGVMRETHHADVLLNANVTGFSGNPGNLTVQTESSEYSGFNAILVACGFKPRIELAKEAELSTARGIKVDALMTTSDPIIFALGDVAECVDGKIYAYVSPIRNQAIWLAKHIAAGNQEPWIAPPFKPKAKVHGFTAAHPYLF